MLRAIRAHSNFIEYTPLALFSMALLEYNNAHFFFIHLLGLLILVGRVLHAFGVSQVNENFKFRVSGMLMTFSCLITSSLLMLYIYLKEIFTHF
jgi:uncharacterized membrane protein YecN with MAPEG domain